MRADESAKLKTWRALRLDFALRLVWQSAPGWTMASLALLVVQGALPLVSLYLTKLVVDAVTTALASPDKGAAFGQVALLIGFMGGVALVGALCRSIAGLVSEAQGQVVTDHVSDLLHAKSIEIDLEYYESAQYYDKLHRAQREAPFRPIRILNGLGQVAQSGISLLAMAGLLFSFHWGIVAILFAAAVPGLLVRLKYAGQTYRWQRQRTPAERQSWYFHWMLTGDVHAKEIRLFDLGSLFMGRFRDLRQQLRRERLEIATRRSIAELVGQASATIAIFGSYAFIAYRTVQGAITLGDLVMYYQAFQRGQGFLRDILSGLAGLYEDNLFLSNLHEFFELKPKVVEPLHPGPVPCPMQTGIAFDHVSFRYPTGIRKVLEDVTLTIRPGEVVALVGENGSGKTTLIKLLCRLYDPTSGIITLDGIDLRRLETTALRRGISIIFQDYAQYHLTARENIWLGNVVLPPDQERIVAAARHAGADEVITGLPQGYETILGKWFENGEELSVGEWQKVALARAFLRDAQIIVLDEPTSALDARAEYEVFKKFRQLAEGRTVVLISHRFSTVRMADRIFVLEDGRIIESGAHDELVRRGGTYARLFETQAQYYR
ncbi:MAG: ABC transporter ATP-binding protein [Chloroflexi bacterium]|nr:ABC transporter ATP-binding protein [Chloroflexota bacterium]